MAAEKKFERPRGTRDFRPEDMAERRWLEGVFRETFRRWGYREIQTPTFESTDLFRAKSGPNVVDEIYTFRDKGDREVCLRPELTAPVMRFYVNDLAMEPKPLKLYYYGSCFRYEEPQEGRYREFWQFGLELLGPEGPAADAEVIAVAHAALRNAGLTRFILHVGHIGVLRALVDAAAPEDKRAQVFRKIDKDDPELPAFLESLGTPDKLRAALLTIARHQRTLDLQDEGAIGAYFAEARAALAPAPLPDVTAALIEKALQDLGETVLLLRAHGVPRLDVDLGVARGLDYYTGMVFELEAPDLGAQKQIGGGGAYTLAELFGGEHVGSCGFGLGFDRILLALKREGVVPPQPAVAEVYVAVLGEKARAPALDLARSLRETGLSIEADLMGRSLGKSMQHAAKLGAKLVVIVGEKDLANGTVTVRDMTSGAQENVPLADVVAAVGKRVQG